MEERRRLDCESLMRLAPVVVLLAITSGAQSIQEAESSQTTEDLRGVKVVSEKVAWASGTHGTYLRTADGGAHWTAAVVPGAEALDFRAVAAFSADEAFLMSIGTGEQSRIYHTNDGGQHWSLEFTNNNPKGFFDSMAFWDAKHGIVIGDPVPDANGKLEFELFSTEDGQSWRPMASSDLPAAIEGEGAFAASNTCIAIEGDDVWFATGGTAARVFHSADRGKTWQVVETPIVHGKDSQGIFSIAFRDAMHGVIAGGDYKHPRDDGPNLAFTDDGGKSWRLSKLKPQAFFSAVAYDLRSEYQAAIFAVNPRFIFDLRAPNRPMRISPGKRAKISFNAVSPYPVGGALFVGPKGTVVRVSPLQ